MIYFNEFKLKGIRHGLPRERFDDPEKGAYEVDRSVALREEPVKLQQGILEAAFKAIFNDPCNDSGMGLITDAINIFRRDIPESRKGCLQIVYSLPQVALSGKDERFQALRGVSDIFSLGDADESFEDLFIREATVPEERAATLNRLNDFC